ncbi:MAG: hypothetical protein HS128_16490 [Ideonella sp.]|nr:hypothetical protein [Ideonella sp.]MCC7456893.1 hypothetical protein [Nitrospira sp.]
MAALYCMGMVLFYLFVFRPRGGSRSGPAKLLWWTYLGLGISATVISLSDTLKPTYPPNHFAIAFLLLCVLVSVAGFLRFRNQHVAHALLRIPYQNWVEAVLIVAQSLAIAFFLPFALDSLTGDANEHRLELLDKMEELGSYGVLNTAAGAASQLFAASLLLAFVRLGRSPARQNTQRALLLVGGSLSYVAYILAYVGRDGIVYWAMTAGLLFVIFRNHLTPRTRRQMIIAGAALAGLMLIPFAIITIARFADSGHGTVWSILDYYGSQINNFSDYSSLERPLTLGTMNFPMFIGGACSLVGATCPNYEDIKEFVFAQYLAQGKEPWLFGTFVSDFVGDFSYEGTLFLLAAFALLCDRMCSTNPQRRPLTLARLQFLVFLFLVPYWGVFYFRFSIINGFIVVNLIFFTVLWLLQRLGANRRQTNDLVGRTQAFRSGPT